MSRKTIDLGTTERGTLLRAPMELLTSVQTIVANRGRGKSWFARTLAEQSDDASLHFCCIDPTGVWWGIAAPWSKTEGQACDVVIFGGDQGHLPLLPESGRRIAQFVVESRQNVVLDTSAMRKGRTHQFMADFLEELFALKGRKGNRTPLHLFWDETEQSAPQRGSADQMRVLGAAEDCSKLGRSRGFGMTLITQRPATLNKNLLDLSDTIYVMGLPSPRDKKAVLLFLEDDMPPEQLTTVRSSLASLPRGECWAWSPRFDFFERIIVGQIRTYDSMRTPEPGEVMQTVEKREVDLHALAAELEEYVEKAKADDPKELRKKIAHLERELKQEKKTVVDENAIRAAELARDKHWQGEIAKLLSTHKSLVGRLHKIHDLAAVNGEAAVEIVQPKETAGGASGLQPRRTRPVAAPKRADRPARVEFSGDLPKGEAITLAALIQFPDGLRREQLTVLTGYKRSSRDAYLQRLRERGLVDTGGVLVQATEEGHAALPDAAPLPTGPELQEYWLARLPEGERAILSVLIDAYPEQVARTDLDDVTGYKRSSRDAYLQRLKAKQLVNATRGEVCASENLF